MSDAAVLQKIQRIHMIGELTKGACSMFGANSTATPDGALLQLRALDWDVDGVTHTHIYIHIYTHTHKDAHMHTHTPHALHTFLTHPIKSPSTDLPSSRLRRAFLGCIESSSDGSLLCRSLQELPSGHSLPPSAGKWPHIRQHWLDRLDRLHHWSAAPV